MYDSILVPTDGSDVAESAATAAITVAERFDARLHVIHVLELGELPPGVEDVDADDLAHHGEDAVATIAERAESAGVEVTTGIVEGANSIHEGIITAAQEQAADLIVMGTYGRTGLDRFVLGSVAEQTLRESPIPVMTVHEQTVVEAEPAGILVPTDGSEAAGAAADHAIELAAATGAPLHVLNVVDTGAVWGDVDVGMVLSALEAAGREAIADVVKRAKATDVETVEASLSSGSTHRAILDYVDENDVDCIVMGTRGRTGLDRYILGSVTERVVRLSEVPVIATRQIEPGD
jgi:nucleotide-binding universal stress UspA family protein